MGVTVETAAMRPSGTARETVRRATGCVFRTTVCVRVFVFVLRCACVRACRTGGWATGGQHGRVAKARALYTLGKLLRLAKPL